MKRKYYLLLVLLPAILLAGGWRNQSISKVEVKQELLQKFQTIKTQYEQEPYMKRIRIIIPTIRSKR